MKKKTVLDSFALLVFLGNESGCEKIKALLTAEDSEVFINDINLGETYCILARERGDEQADYFLEVIFPALPIIHLANGLREVIDAARVMAKYALSYADCFGIATARSQGASLVTGDPEFKKVQDLIELDFI